MPPNKLCGGNPRIQKSNIVIIKDYWKNQIGKLRAFVKFQRGGIHLQTIQSRQSNIRLSFYLSK
jgi:hypothetical protein